MILGVPKEIKKEEYRVALIPAGAMELVSEGNEVLLEEGAGLGSGFSDEEYRQAGVKIKDKEYIFSHADLIIKVKEPLSGEYGLFRPRQALFAFLHLAPNPGLIGVLLEKKISALAYETLEAEGGLPLLAPMSEIAGKMAPVMAAYYLQRPHGGSGVFPCGLIGVPPAKCLIIGAGVVGTNAARIAYSIGMDTVVMNKTMDRLRKIDELFMGKVKTMPLEEEILKREIREADVLICAVLVPGGKTPVLVTRQMLKTMRKGSVIVDVSVDQGGCVETSRPTTHEDPVYETEGIIHYTVANMPGAYPRTGTVALANATLPYIKEVAALGVEGAVARSPALRSALNVYRGKVVHPFLARSMGAEPAELDELLATKPPVP